MSLSSTSLASTPVAGFEERGARGGLFEVGESTATLAADLRRCDIDDDCGGSVNRFEAVIAAQVGGVSISAINIGRRRRGREVAR